MKILIDETSGSPEENAPAYKDFKVGRVCVGGKFFIIKMKERSPEQICDIHQKWAARCTRNTIKKQIKDAGLENREKKI